MNMMKTLELASEEIFHATWYLSYVVNVNSRLEKLFDMLLRKYDTNLAILSEDLLGVNLEISLLSFLRILKLGHFLALGYGILQEKDAWD